MAGGGSGGHITPLLSLAQEIKLQSPKSKVVYIGHRGENFVDLIDARLFDKTYAISAGKFRRYPINPVTLFRNVIDLFKLLIGIVQSMRVISRVRPNVLLSKGGFVALPVGIAAKLKGVPIVTHDSDSVPGLTNRILNGWAKVNATGMPAYLYPYSKDKIRYIGVPIDPKFNLPLSESAKNSELEKIGASPESQVLLVVGGSLGAKSINTVLPEIAGELLDRFPKLHIVHIAGNKSAKETKEAYEANLKSPTTKQRVKVLGLSKELYALINVASLVVTRAGATALAEMAALAKPCVVVPSPFVSAGQQLLNAKYYEEQGSICIINNNANNSDWLNTISSILGDKNKLQELSKSIGKLAKKDAAKELSGVLIGVASKEQ